MILLSSSTLRSQLPISVWVGYFISFPMSNIALLLTLTTLAVGLTITVTWQKVHIFEAVCFHNNINLFNWSWIFVNRCFPASEKAALFIRMSIPSFNLIKLDLRFTLMQFTSCMSIWWSLEWKPSFISLSLVISPLDWLLLVRIASQGDRWQRARTTASPTFLLVPATTATGKVDQEAIAEGAIHRQTLAYIWHTKNNWTK